MAITLSGTYRSGVLLADPAAQNPATIAAGALLAPSGGAALLLSGLARWTIANAGTIRADDAVGNPGLGIVMSAGGTVANAAGGLIGGGQNGIRIDGVGMITNAGTITGALAIGLGAGGSVVNAAGGAIIGAAGIRIDAGVATVDNAGTILAPNSSAPAVAFADADGNRMVLRPGGTIAGRVIGGAGSDTLALAAGAGTIAWIGAHYTGFETLRVDPGASWRMAGLNTLGNATIDLAANGRLTVAGTLEAPALALGGPGGITLLSTGAVALGGAAPVAGALVVGEGAAVDAGGLVTIAGSVGGAGTLRLAANSGVTIAGALGIAHVAFNPDGREVLDMSGPITGTIDGFSPGDVIRLRGLGTPAAVIANGDDLTVVGTGFLGSVTRQNLHFSGVSGDTAFTLISDGAGGASLVSFRGTPNYWRISPGARYLSGFTPLTYVLHTEGLIAGTGITGSPVINQFISNTGTVLGAVNGVTLPHPGSSVDNSGQISGKQAGIVGADLVFNNAGGTIAGARGVVQDRYQRTTIFNAGTIIGSAGIAVTLTHPDSLVRMEPGAQFVGRVVAAGTLELAPGPDTGALGRIGDRFAGFRAVTIDPGASWILDGASTIANFVRLRNDGRLTAISTMLVYGDFDGDGTLALGRAATVAIGGTLAADRVLFGPGGSQTLRIGDPAGFAGTIDGFKAGEILDLSGIGGASVAGFGGGVLTLAAPAGLVTLAFSGSFDAARFFAVPDGQGGTALSYDGPAALPGSVTLAAGAVQAAGYRLDGGALVNHGTIRGTGVGGAGIVFRPQVENDGTILAAYGQNGIALPIGGTIANLAGGTIRGSVGILMQGGPATIANAGSIGGALGPGISLMGGGTVTNQPGGTITGGDPATPVPGIMADSAATIVNAGAILAPNGAAPAISLKAGGRVDNLAGGTIGGIGVAAGAATVANAGTIRGGIFQAGTWLPTGAPIPGIRITNGEGAVITYGFHADAPGAVLDNAGTLGSGGIGSSELNGTLINRASGTIGDRREFGSLLLRDGGASLSLLNDGYIGASVTVAGSGTVVNGGTIAAGLYSSSTDVMNAGFIGGVALFRGTLVNAAGAGIRGWYTGVRADRATLVNAGTISVAATYIAYGVVAGVSLYGGRLTNLATGRIDGLLATGGGATVDNAGTIIGDVWLDGAPGGRLVNRAGGAIRGELSVAAPDATIDNAGLIDLTGSSGHGYGIFEAGGRVINRAGGTIAVNRTMPGDFRFLGQPGTVVNGGLMGVSISLAAGGLVSNQAGGVIGRVIPGQPLPYVYARGPGARVTNAGFIAGVVLDGGTLTNQAGGTVAHWFYAVQLGDAATLVNAGTIAQTGPDPSRLSQGVSLGAGDRVRNLAGGTISGYVGIRAVARTQPGSSTVTNAGTIIGNGGTALALAAGVANRVGLTPDAVFGGIVDGGSQTTPGVVNTLELMAGGGTGTLAGLGSQFRNFSGIEIARGASWVLGQPVVPEATVVSLGTLLVPAALYSRGLIQGSVSLLPGGVLTNGPGGTIAAPGAAAVTGRGSVINTAAAGISGRIGIRLLAPGAITNAGSIAGTAAGIQLDAGGSVVNLASGTIAGAAGIRVPAGAATIVNAGAILAPNGSAPAIRFADADGNRLVVQPGGVILGQVQGGAGLDTLELGAGAGSLAWIGAHYTGFETLAVQPGGQWRMTGLNAIGSGATLAISAGSGLAVAGTLLVAGDVAMARLGTLTALATGAVAVGGAPAVAGAIAVAAGHGIAGFGALAAATLIDDGTITAAGGALRLAGSLAGAGTVAIDAQAIMAIYGAVGLPRIAFLPGDGQTLLLGDPGQVAATIDGFGATDRIGLPGAGLATGVSFAGGALTVDLPAGAVTLHFAGPYDGARFAVAGDGHGGTLLTYA